MVPTFGHEIFFTLAFLTSEVVLENNHCKIVNFLRRISPLIFKIQSKRRRKDINFRWLFLVYLGFWAVFRLNFENEGAKWNSIFCSDFIKVRTFWEKHTKFEKKTSSCIGHLLSKPPDYEEDFFQILCASQNVRTLNLKICNCLYL